MVSRGDPIAAVVSQVLSRGEKVTIALSLRTRTSS